MAKDDRVEELKATYGPPPADPIQRSIWEHGLELLADLPEHVAAVVRAQGSDHPTLQEIFGDLLPDLEAEVVWRYIRERKREEVLSAAKEVLGSGIWPPMLIAARPVQKTRITARLADDAANHMGRIVLGTPVYRAWFIDDGP